MAVRDPREILRDIGAHPSRARGQHFLVDGRVAGRILDHARVAPGETVLEIGPGLGVLTQELVRRARRVVAIESDRRFAGYLRRAVPQAEILEGDALEVDWPSFDVMVSNLPYQISSPVTFRLLGLPFDRAVLMYQWEFARRMVAAPGTPDYSRLSVGVYVRADCRILERVPRNAFRPQPKVDSAVVLLEPRPCPFEMRHPDVFDAVVDALFQHRRKTVENGLRLAARSFARTDAEFEASLSSAPHRSRRVEELRPEEIAQIADAMATTKG